MEHSSGSLIPPALAVLDLLFLLLPLPLIVIANWHDAPPTGSSTMARGAAFLGTAVWMLLAMVAAVSVILGLFTVAFSPPRPGLVFYAIVMLLTGIAAAAIISDSVRSAIARIIPIDPRSAVHATALVLTIVLVGSQLANQLAVDVLSQQASAGPELSPLDLVAQELPFLLAAVLGVGLFIRRGPAATMLRLGLVRPTGWQLILGLGAAFVFFAFGNGMDALNHALSPGTAQKVEAANQHLFGQLSNPLGIATIALSAGICEEALFRGAMQPRLSILWTAIVFTTVHTQYGLSLDAVAVLVLAIGLGLIRRVANTTTSTVCHVVYNTLVGVVGVGVSGVLLGPAVIAGAVLVAASAAAFFTGRLGSLKTAP
ncbi:MAG TPA: CPBP family intramembrane glutamic endopeptidase [Terriglobales bacterium]|nr:CPBP family intramembrane glutamic endopeptidase [Terriglobales bacterium]